MRRSINSISEIGASSSLSCEPDGTLAEKDLKDSSILAKSTPALLSPSSPSVSRIDPDSAEEPD